MGYRMDNIKDQLEEINLLVDPHIIIAEFIPFGRNSVVAFNNKLDSFKRVKSSLISAFQDTTPAGTQFRIEPTQTKIDVIDFHASEFVKFNAQVFFPEEVGIVQEEKFGIYLNQTGKIILGMHVLQVGKSREKVSVDVITRLFSDVIFDSSTLLDTLLTNHQRRILDLVFFNKAGSRDKYVCLTAKSIEPKRPIAEYLDGEENENELKQVLEYVDKTAEWDDGTQIFVGTHGLILCTVDHKEYELILANFGFLKAIDIFLSNFFSRVWSLEDDIKEIHRKAIQDFERDPRSVGIAQTQLSGLTQDCILLEETRVHIENALVDTIHEFRLMSQNLDAKQKRLTDFLQIDSYVKAILARVQDTRKLVEGLNNDVQGLRDQVNVINEKRLQGIFNQLKDSTNVQMRMTRAAERQDSKMQILQLILCGSLVLQIIALFVGQYSFIEPIGGALEMGPYAFFGLNMVVWIAFALVLSMIMRRLSKSAEDASALKLDYHVPINLDNLEAMLGKDNVTRGDVEQTENRVLRTVTCYTVLEKSMTQMTVTYDTQNSFLYNISLSIEKPRKTAKVYKKAVDEYLKKHQVFA